LNRKLQKLVKINPHSNFLETRNDRNLFTNHGLHRNKQGKNLVKFQLASFLLITFAQNTAKPIPLEWHEICIAINDSEVIKECKVPNRNSCRNRKIPVTRTKDFFMDNLSPRRIIRDSKNAGSKFKSNINPSSSKVNNFDVHNFDVHNNTFMSPSTPLNKLRPINFKILHQNIRGIFHKTDEFLISLGETSPHVLCITEHHLRMDELNNINLGNYILGSQYCRQSLKQGGVSIFVSSDIQFHTINLNHFNKEKDLEICALRIGFRHENLIIICIYRSPTGNFEHFINQLEVILDSLYKVSTHLILCGDFNINHLEACNRTIN